MTHASRVQRYASGLYFMTIGLMVVIVASTIAVPLWMPPTAETLQVAFPNVSVAPQITGGLIAGVLAVGLVPVVAWLWTLNQMRRLFGSYRTGAILTDTSAATILGIGCGLLAIAVALLAVIPLQSVLLTWANGAGGRSLQVAVSSEMWALCLSGGLMIVIGWAMQEASAIKSENAAFV